MNFARKLKEVVAANFIEIARPDAETAAAAAAGPSDGTEPKSEAFRHEDFPSGPVLDGAATELPAVFEPEEAAAQESAGGPGDDSVWAVAASPTGGAEAGPEEGANAGQDTALVTDFVGEEGDVDFERVYRHHGIPPSKFTAEQALTMLSTMPRDLPLRVKRLTVKATLDAIGNTIGATPETVSADAMAKRQSLERFIDELQDETISHREIVEAEISALEQEIVERRQLLQVAARKHSQAEKICQAKAETLEQIIAFFEADETTDGMVDPSASAPAGDMDELPPFMREDAVLRLLGITQDQESGASSAPEPQAVGKKGGIRRRTVIRRAL